MQLVPESYRDLISDRSKAIAYLATMLDNGAPITAPIWFDVQGEFFRFATSPNSLKFKNMVARPQVSLLIQDPDEVYRYMQVRGRYAEHTTVGSAAYLHRLSRRYIGTDYPAELGGDDVIVSIRPEKVNVFAWDD